MLGLKVDAAGQYPPKGFEAAHACTCAETLYYMHGACMRQAIGGCGEEVWVAKRTDRMEGERQRAGGLS